VPRDNFNFTWDRDVLLVFNISLSVNPTLYMMTMLSQIHPTNPRSPQP
jgi:hypothetical protein